jgi:glucose-6-phosphate isomerase
VSHARHDEPLEPLSLLAGGLEDRVPFTRLIDMATGAVSPDARTVRRTLTDMRGAYQQDAQGDDLVYEVHNIDVAATNANILTSTTVLYPGKVGEEFYMTKGHFHEVRDRAEIYIGLAGGGLLLSATEDGRHDVQDIVPGSMTYVPGGWSHRSVNTGTEPLVFFAAYVGDAGHDYAAIEDRGFPVAVMAGPAGRPEYLPNPRFLPA